MKKSLSTILSLAMAFSMFSSVAFGEEAAKSSADFSDLKDLDAATKAKFDEMISAGVFDGVSEGTFGLKDKMNRAQFAKVAALIFKLKVDTSLKTSSFTDVQADDPANGYALPYIEAVKAAGITDGYAPGEYNPAGEVTKEQLATFLIRGLGKDAEAQATPGVSDKTVSDWAKGYVALALQLKLLSSGTDGTFGGTSAATRDLLVLGSYEAKQQYKPVFSGKYAIESFKATDANELTLQLNGALSEDAAKNLKIDVKKDGSSVTSGFTTKWSDDKTTATLTFDNKFGDNKYDVTISGLDNIDETAATASVTTTKETITKIDFLTASDTIPNAMDKNDKAAYKIRVDFKATNQYGKQSSLTASNFDIRVSNGSFSTIAGEQAINLTEEDETERNDRISITILHEDSGVQVNKIFTVGDEALVSKVEVGDLLNSTGNKIDAIEAQGYAYLDLKAYDQYGFRVQDKDLLNDGISVTTSNSDLDTEDDPFVDDAVGDDAADLKLVSSEKEDAEITISIFARGGQSVTKTVKVEASKVPATVEFGSYNYTLAEGDAVTNDEAVDNKLFVPLVLKDAKGELLDADEIVDAFDDEKLDIDSTSGINLVDNAEIARTGAHKGQIQINNVDRKGNQQITVGLEDYPTQRATFSINVGEEREAQEIKFSTTPKKTMVAGADATFDNELKFKIYDQQGSEYKFDTNEDVNYFVKVSFTANSVDPNAPAGSAAKTYLASKQGNQVATDKYRTYTFKADPNSGTAEAVVPAQNSATSGGTVAKSVYATFDLKTNNAGLDWENIFDKSFKVYSEAGAPTATYNIKAELFKVEDGETDLVDDVSSTLEVIDPKKSENKLTYEAYLDKGLNNTILAADDYLNRDTTTDATYLNTNLSRLGKEVKVRAKNNSGEDVSIQNKVISISSSNPSVVGVAGNRIYGLDAGTSKLNVIFRNAKGEQQTATIDVTTKNEGPIVSTISLKKTGKQGLTVGSLINKYVWDAELAEKITVKDQYGDEIVTEGYNNYVNEESKATDQFFLTHNSVLGLSFFATDVEGGGSVTIDPTTGQITDIDGTVTSFVINVISPSGVTASFSVN